MKPLYKSVLAVGGALVIGGTPFGCADDGGPDSLSGGANEGTDARVAERDASVASEASAGFDAGVQTGRCSASKVCIVDVPVDEERYLTAIWGSSADDVWAVGAGGTVLHYDGQSWQRDDQQGNDGLAYTLHSVWLERPDDVWMIDGFYIRHSAGWRGPGMNAWSYHPLAPAVAARATFAGTGDDVWLTGNTDALITKFAGWHDDGPAAFQSFIAPLPEKPTSDKVRKSRSDELWVIATCRPPRTLDCVYRGSLAAPDGGTTDAAVPVWTFELYDSRATRSLSDVWGDDDGAWLVGQGGTLRHIARAAVPGKTFEIVPSPVTTDLLAVFGVGRDHVWAVGDESTIVHWDGTTWTKLTTPFDDSSDKPTFTAIWGSSASDVWIASKGTLLHLQE